MLDTNLVEGIDFITGGMTAEYGDYMSGVVGLQTRRPSPDDEYRSGVGISFVSLYGRTSGTFAGDRGSWLVSARRGFLDVLMERVVADDETAHAALHRRFRRRRLRNRRTQLRSPRAC